MGPIRELDQTCIFFIHYRLLKDFSIVRSAEQDTFFGFTETETMIRKFYSFFLLLFFLLPFRAISLRIQFQIDIFHSWFAASWNDNYYYLYYLWRRHHSTTPKCDSMQWNENEAVACTWNSHIAPPMCAKMRSDEAAVVRSLMRFWRQNKKKKRREKTKETQMIGGGEGR